MKTKSLFYILLFLIIVFFTACSYKNLPADFNLDKDKNTGVVYASIYFVGSKSKFDLFLRYRSLDGKIKGSIPVTSYNDLHYGKLQGNLSHKKDPAGYLAIFALPAGQYEFYKVSVNQGKHTGDYSKRFDVVAGKVNYPGSVYIHFTYPKKNHYRYQIKIRKSKYKKRDTELLLQKYPQFKQLEIVK